MRIDRYDFDSSLSQDTVDEIINSLSIGIDDFSRIACLDGRAYGVVTACDTCDLDLNACIRSHIIRLLASSQQTAENMIGYRITEGYHTQEILWDGKTQILAGFRGIEAINVRREFSTVEGYGPFEISPYVLTAITVTDSGNGYCETILDGSIVKNPNRVTFRDDDGKVYRIHSTVKPRRNGSGNWIVAFDNQIMPPCTVISPINVQICDLMILDVPEYEDCEVVPVYPNSNQIIPMAKEPEDIGSGIIRYRFHPWVLVDDAFSDETVDLESGEFYKLLQEVEFKCVEDVACDPFITLRKYDGSVETYEVTEEDLNLYLLDGETGVIRIDYHPCSAWCNGIPIKITFCYKTNPDVLELHHDLSYLNEAIAMLAAAELPISTCGCKIEKGYISDAQKPFTQVRVNALTNEAVVNEKYGETYGQLVFKEKISRVTKLGRMIRV